MLLKTFTRRHRFHASNCIVSSPSLERGESILIGIYTDTPSKFFPTRSVRRDSRYSTLRYPYLSFLTSNSCFFCVPESSNRYFNRYVNPIAQNKLAWKYYVRFYYSEITGLCF